ncbi:PQQ-binding-like beta-propeller repeat protein [bacterium]|jgi:outer membrane protein assembly factor BamB|nr:PQQ-binding-like beta-propeller repeat protein [bacterium]
MTLIMIRLTILLMLISSVHADDWPQWGGPQRDLIWRETGIVKQLPSGKLPRVWSTPIGEGYAGPAVAEGMVFVTDRIHGRGREGIERVLALDSKSGEIIWKHEYPCLYNISYPGGPRATPVFDNGHLYTIGAVGNMFCFEAKTGEVLWSKNFQQDFGVRLPTWGMAASPLVEKDQLIALVGARNGLLISFDKLTGEEQWRSLDDSAIGYCPPVIFDFGKSRQLISWHPRAVSSVDPQTGQVNWEVPFEVRAGLTLTTPRKVGNRLFLTAFYNGSLMLDVADDGSGVKRLWKGSSNSEINTDGLHGLMCTPFFDGENIFGVGSFGQLRCLNAQTGERIWETLAATGEGRWWNAFIIPHEDRFFIHNEQGELIIARLTKSGYEEISRAQLIEPTRDVRRRMTIWSHPAFAEQSVFARNDKELIRVSLAE